MDTGIPASVWWAEDPADLATALELRDDAAAEEKQHKRRDDEQDGVVMGG